MSRLSITLLLLALAALLCPPSVFASEVKATHEDAEVRLQAPDRTTGGEGFALEVAGELDSGPFSVFAYRVARDATWHYDEDHQVVWDKPGATLADERFNSGDSLKRSFPQDLPPGTYTFSFAFGQRTGAHGWYDVVLDVTVEVQAADALCGVEWISPKSDQIAAGKPLSLKFTANQCADGEFFADQDIVVLLNTADGGLIQGWLASSDPTRGVVVDEAAKEFHVEWASEGYGQGVFVLEVQFSTGQVLTRNLTLK